MRLETLVFAAAAALAAGAAPAALAHAKLEQAVPAPGSVVSPAPARLRLQFNEPLELPFSKVKLVDDRGATLGPGKLAIDPADPKTLVADVPPLRAGAYRVEWTTVTRDGHKVKGEYGFRVR